MLRSEHPLGVRRHLLEQLNGVIDASGVLVGAGEVVAAGQGVGVVGSQDAFVVCGDLFVEGGGLVGASERRGADMAEPEPPFVRDGEFYDPADTALSDPRHVFAIVPTRVFAFGKEEGFTATRWRF